jgi:hypothetical protein
MCLDDVPAVVGDVQGGDLGVDVHVPGRAYVPLRVDPACQPAREGLSPGKGEQRCQLGLGEQGMGADVPGGEIVLQVHAEVPGAVYGQRAVLEREGEGHVFHGGVHELDLGSGEPSRQGWVAQEALPGGVDEDGAPGRLVLPDQVDVLHADPGGAQRDS